MMTVGILMNDLMKTGYHVSGDVEYNSKLDIFSTSTDDLCNGTDVGAVLIQSDEKAPDDLDNFAQIKVIVHPVSVGTGEVKNHHFLAAEFPSSRNIQQAVCDVAGSFLRQTQWEKQMTQKAADQLSLHSYLGLLSEKLNNPIALFDRSLNLLTSAGGIPENTDGTIWDMLKSNGRVADSFYTGEDLEKLMSSEEAEAVCFHPKNDPSHLYVSVPVYIHDKIIAYLGMMDIKSEINAGEIDILLSCSSLLEIFFSQNKTYLASSNDPMFFYREMLEGRNISPELVHMQLSSRGWLKTPSFRVLSFSDGKRKSEEKLIFALRQLSSDHPSWPLVIHNSMVTTSIPSSDVKNIVSDGTFVSFLEEFHLACGISSSFTDFSRSAVYSIQSEFAAGTSSGADFIFYDNCEYAHVLSLLSSGVQEESLIHPSIQKLWETGGQDLVENLMIYLLNGRNTALTARAVHMHRNSLIYRLGKIENLLGENLHEISSEKAFYYLISCMLLLKFRCT